ncbi:MAG: tetratricopeptide repeat protein [Nitrospira sp.]|nr:tetratricopeptide repeat protein [Nitrospira sp.]MBP6604490.1 tetratricopeptide repeat protein [Nitrospira sp.]HQY57860.1 tetratricopeptide repeat protein [Nitrospira sp.]HRA97527.1 tetratricopeptide repeat protein [Nitrospira sp.]
MNSSIYPRVRRMFVGLVALCAAGTCGSVTMVHAQVGKPEGLYYKSWAVVVGIENYLVAPKVPGAVESAHAVATALRGLGFDEVIELQDKEASSRHLLQILNDYLPRKVGRQDRVLFFFAGHAGITQDAQSKELGYLVPWDAQLNNSAKAITFDQLKEFSRRSASKHMLMLFDANIHGWEVTAPQPLSLEGRSSQEDEMEKRAIQVLTAAEKEETVGHVPGQSAFVTALVAGLSGAADLNKNGWIMASELAAQVKRDVEGATKGAQHPQFVQLEGDGDVILIEGQKGAFQAGKEPTSEADRMREARIQYEQAFTLLQRQESAEEALERLNRAIGYDPSFGDAYVLKSYIRLEVLPNLEESLLAARAAVQHAPQNPDSHYSLALALEKNGQYQDAEQAMQQALVVNPAYGDVYFSLGALYADHLNEPQKSVDAFRRYLELGGQSERAIRAVQSSASPADKPAP